MPSFRFVTAMPSDAIETPFEYVTIDARDYESALEQVQSQLAQFDAGVMSSPDTPYRCTCGRPTPEHSMDCTQCWLQAESDMLDAEYGPEDTDLDDCQAEFEHDQRQLRAQERAGCGCLPGAWCSRCQAEFEYLVQKAEDRAECDYDTFC